MMQAQRWVPFLASVCLFFSAPVMAQNGYVQQQTIDLVPGWNAVYLEIDPLESNPAILFGGTPVDVVASFTTSTRGAQYVKNPSVSMLNSYGWAVWYAPSRSDAFLTSLYSMLGAKPYLIHARTNVSMVVTGTAAPRLFEWKPNAYNFVGYTVAQPGSPTFGQFFGGSPAHNHNKIYRLVDGTWRQVLSPTATSMRAGEAFWIYCDGRSDYPGPLEVTTRSMSLGVMLTSQMDSHIDFLNRTQHPISFTIEHVVDPAQPIPMSVPVDVLEEDSGGQRSTLHVHFDAGFFEQQFPPLEAGKAIRLPLSLRLQDAGPGERHSLLKVVTDMGTITYLPVTANREDLP
jgi:hypothetical protein